MNQGQALPCGLWSRGGSSQRTRDMAECQRYCEYDHCSLNKATRQKWAQVETRPIGQDRLQEPAVAWSQHLRARTTQEPPNCFLCYIALCPLGPIPFDAMCSNQPRSRQSVSLGHSVSSIMRTDTKFSPLEIRSRVKSLI